MLEVGGAQRYVAMPRVASFPFLDKSSTARFCRLLWSRLAGRMTGGQVLPVGPEIEQHLERHRYDLSPEVRIELERHFVSRSPRLDW
jgi:hypothetical protein